MLDAGSGFPLPARRGLTARPSSTGKKRTVSCPTMPTPGGVDCRQACGVQDVAGAPGSHSRLPWGYSRGRARLAGWVVLTPEARGTWSWQSSLPTIRSNPSRRLSLRTSALGSRPEAARSVGTLGRQARRAWCPRYGEITGRPPAPRTGTTSRWISITISDTRTKSTSIT